MKIARIALSSAILAAATLASTAHAEPEVMGMKIGQKLSLPVCSAQTADSDCYHDDEGNRPTPMSFGYSIYAAHLHDAPEFAKLIGVVTDQQGVVEGFYISTKGYDWQNAAFTSLQAKFGAPSFVETDKMQNDLDAQYDAISASWKPEGAIVSFNGVSGDPGEGRILVMSAKMQEMIRTVHESKLASAD